MRSFRLGHLAITLFLASLACATRSSSGGGDDDGAATGVDTEGDGPAGPYGSCLEDPAPCDVCLAGDGGVVCTYDCTTEADCPTLEGYMPVCETSSCLLACDTAEDCPDPEMICVFGYPSHCTYAFGDPCGCGDPGCNSEVVNEGMDCACLEGFDWCNAEDPDDFSCC